MSFMDVSIKTACYVSYLTEKWLNSLLKNISLVYTTYLLL